jgi:arylsulfatase
MMGGAASAVRAQGPPSNIIVILADDLGYGDLGCQGSRLRTPNIDQLAREGTRFTNFYAPSSVCSPSRAALLTGRYPVRMNIPSVLFPDDARGIPETETTIAQMLQKAGYRTACFGKWHVGDRAQYLPVKRGFDEFYGLPYSHDMLPLRLMRGEEVLSSDPRLETLTQSFTEEAVNFIGRNAENPFLLYMPHTAPHIPLLAGRQFRGKSRFGPYGDNVQELDWSVGQVLNAVRENGLDDKTLVVFTSDNGPWYQGSNGTLRGRKGETFEGGMRVPFIARMNGSVTAGRVVSSMGTLMDLLPTAARLAGTSKPGLPLDGVDLWPVLNGETEEVARPAFLYFDSWQLQCARVGKWKLHLSRYNYPPWMPGPARVNLPLTRPELYDLETDAEESYDEAADNPEVVAQIRGQVEQALLTFPDSVRSAYQGTMRLKVEDTPAGAYPVQAP